MFGRLWKRKAASVCVLAALPLGSCLFETATSDSRSGAGAIHDLAYTVTSDSGGRGCRVDIRILDWPANEPRIFQSPVFYADNPVMPAPGYKAADLRVRDASGKLLSARDTLIPGIGLDGNFIVLPKEARSLGYAVDLAPKDPARFGLPVPGTAAGVELIDGAYYFILPLLGRDYPSQWRTPARFSLEFAPVAGRTLVGVDSVLSFTTNYQLMFVRAAFNPVKSMSFPYRNHDVTLYTTTPGGTDLDTFSILFRKCIRVVEDSLMPLPGRAYCAGENPQFWGIEGVQGYWFKAEARDLAAVHVHEIAHTFVGVHHSDLEDPWWKEGLTNYLGNLLALQAGLIGDTVFANEMLTVRDTFPAVERYALSSPFVRSHLFPVMDSAFVEPPVPENYIALVYGKGGQASMILDRYILEHSGGKRSVFDLVRDVVASYGPAFRRADLVASVDRLTGGSSAAFLSSLLDHPDPLGQDSLVHTYAVLRALGRFAPGGGKSPIQNVDPPGEPNPAGKRSGTPGPAPSRQVTAVPAGSKL